jgi:hypothetical protein
MTTTRKKKPVIGDVFTFLTDKGFTGFIQYLGSEKWYDCSLLWIESETGQRTAERIIFYPVWLNIRHGNLTFLANESPRREVPTHVRRMGTEGLNGWWFIDDGQENALRVNQLSKEQEAFPNGCTISHLVILDWINGGGWEYCLGKPPSVELGINV